MNGRVHANRIESFWSGQNGEKPSGHLAIGPVCLASLASLALQLQVCQSCPLNIDIISTLACIFFLLFSLFSFGTLENHWGLCIPAAAAACLLFFVACFPAASTTGGMSMTMVISNASWSLLALMARNYVYSGTSNEMGSAQQLNKKKN